MIYNNGGGTVFPRHFAVTASHAGIMPVNESPGERERAQRPFRALIEPGGVYAGFAAITS